MGQWDGDGVVSLCFEVDISTRFKKPFDDAIFSFQGNLVSPAKTWFFGHDQKKRRFWRLKVYIDAESICIYMYLYVQQFIVLVLYFEWWEPHER